MNRFDPEEKKELVWIPARLKKEFDEIEDEKKKELLILRYIEDFKQNLKSEIESLDDDVASFKGSMIKAKNAFEDTKNFQLNASYEMWEKFDKEMPKLQQKVDKTVEKLQPLANKVEEINQALEKIRSYQIKDLLEVVKELEGYLSYKNNTGDILKFLFENYNKKD